MPNWVFNDLHIEGSEEAIQKVKAQLNAPYTRTYEDEGVVTFSNPVFAFWNIVRPPEDKLDEYEGVHGFKDGEKQGQGEFNWYNFNNREWGTKWDVGVSDNQKYSETTISEVSPTKISYHFQTAWSPPLSVIEALSLQNPEVEITLDYEEEQGWGGKIYWDSTGSSVLEEYDSPDSHADYVKRDNVDSCNCANSEDTDDWYDDCPGKKTTIELFAKRDVTQLT
jgi:hypothetical protein